jgi:hypothetical protein
MSSSPKPNIPVVNPNPGYTDDDIAYGPIIKWTLSLWVVTGIVFAVMIWWFRHSQAAAQAQSPSSSMTAERILPPSSGPLLQANPIRDLDEYKTEMAGKLNRYSVLDKDKGVFQIPVDQAIKRILEKGELK